MQETIELAIALLNAQYLFTPTAAEINKVALTVAVYQEIKQGPLIVGRDVAKALTAIYGLDQKSNSG
jgi:hypothetical protein